LIHGSNGLKHASRKSYPGDEYVDLLGFDQYRIRTDNESAAGAIRRLEVLAEMAAERNKLYALTETGNYGMTIPNWFTEHLLPVLSASEATKGMLYSLTWRNEEDQVDHYFVPYKGHPQEGDFRKFREDELILFEADLPVNLYK